MLETILRRYYYVHTHAIFSGPVARPRPRSRTDPPVPRIVTLQHQVCTLLQVSLESQFLIGRSEPSLPSSKQAVREIRLNSAPNRTELTRSLIRAHQRTTVSFQKP